MNETCVKFYGFQLPIERFHLGKQDFEGFIADSIVISTKSSRTIENMNSVQLQILNNFLILPLHFQIQFFEKLVISKKFIVNLEVYNLRLKICSHKKYNTVKFHLYSYLY